MSRLNLSSQKYFITFQIILEKNIEQLFFIMPKIYNFDTSVPSFVQKAFKIISDQANSQVIEWAPNGKEFFIKDVERFEQSILPNFFRHRNINSFIRQLNMYGFHKSRKEPTKNIFSHPFFQRDKKQLLNQIKRKVKLDENLPQSHEKLHIQDISKNQEEVIKQKNDQDQIKVLIPKSENLPSNTLIGHKSHHSTQKDIQFSPVKNLMISRSFILDINPQICLQHRENVSLIAQEEDEDEKLSIADEINRERQRFNNRTQGISIVKTSNFLQDFEI